MTSAMLILGVSSDIGGMPGVSMLCGIDKMLGVSMKHFYALQLICGPISSIIY